MNWDSVRFDWNQARAFLITAEEGSLSAASRALGQTQPTLSRQVAALEEALGVALFERAGKRLIPTETGLDLVEHVRAMGEAATRVSLAATGASDAVEGRVCISCSDVFAAYLLPEVIARIRDAAPKIEIDILASDEISDLLHREADIALRHVEPTEPELIARRCRADSAQLYAARSYLDRVGRPKRIEDLARLDYIGFDRAGLMLKILAERGAHVPARQLRIRTKAGMVVWDYVRRGLGANFMTKSVADLTPEVEEVWPAMTPVPVPTWLVTHREVRTSRRIRLVFDALLEAFG